jgi:hypothetical protein
MGTDASKPVPASARRRGQQQAAAARRRRKIYVVVAALMVLAIFLFAWLVRFNRFHRAHALLVAVTEYTDPAVPPNAFAVQDCKLLEQIFPRATQRYGQQSVAALLEEGSALQTHDNETDPLVVYLCAPAWADGDDVYLVSTDAQLGDRASALSLRRFLDEVLTKYRGPKLLLLDVMRPVASPYSGVLANRTAERIRSIVEQAAIRKLLVLTACKPGQMSLSSEELGHSVFAYYVALGLSGQADGYAQDKRDGRISLAELAAYVSEQVDHWAMLNAGTHQTPVLLPESPEERAKIDIEPRKVPLILVEGEHGPAPEPRTEEYPEELVRAWHKRDDKQEQAGRLTPAALRQCESDLLRAEQRWRAGGDLRAPRPVEEVAAKLEQRVGQAAAPLIPPSPRSLAAWAREQRYQPDAALVAAVADLLGRLGNLPSEEKARDERQKAALEEFRGKSKGKPAPEAAWALFNGLARESTVGWSKLAAVNELLQELKPTPRYVETELVRELAGYPKDRMPEARTAVEAVFRAAVRAAGFGEIAANGDSRTFAGERKTLQSIAANRRQGRSLLSQAFREDRTSLLKPAEEAFKQAVADAQRVERSENDLSDAYASHDRALTLLTASVPYFAGLPDELPLDDEWLAVLKRTADLRTYLTQSPPATDRLSDPTHRLQAALAELEKLFDATVIAERINKAQQPDSGPRELRQIDLLLLTTLLKADDRKNLWVARRDLARRLLDAADVRRAPVSVEDQESKRAGRRADLSSGLLSLVLPEAKVPRFQPSKPEESARELCQAWTKTLPELLKQEREKKALLAADALSRILLPTDGARQGDGPDEATLQLRRQEVQAHWSWLADTYQAEAQVTDWRGDNLSIFQTAAEDYRLRVP